MKAAKHVIEKVTILQEILVDRATSSNTHRDDEFKKIRTELMENAHIKSKLPPFLTEIRSLGEFWLFIQSKYPTNRIANLRYFQLSIKRRFIETAIPRNKQ